MGVSFMQLLCVISTVLLNGCDIGDILALVGILLVVVWIVSAIVGLYLIKPIDPERRTALLLLVWSLGPFAVALLLILPALVAAIQDADRRVTGVLRIFLTSDGTRKALVTKAKMMRGRCVGGAVRLGPAGPGKASPSTLGRWR